MSLRKKAVVLIATIVAVTSIGVYVVSYRLIEEKFDRLEERRVRLNLDRIQNAFRHEIELLDTLAGDYATWDSTYRYAKDRFPGYAKSELSDETFTSYNLRLFVLIDTEGRVALCRDYRSGSAACADSQTKERLIRTAARIGGPTWELSGSGMLVANGEPMLIVVRPVLKTDGGGPSRGALLMARSVDDTAVVKMARLLAFPVQAFRSEDAQTKARHAVELASVSGDETRFVEAVSREKIAGYLRIDDLDGNAAILFRTELARDLHSEGIVVQRVLFAELFAILMFVAAGAFWVLQRAILRPIAALSATTASITGSGDLSARTEITGDDEFGRLGHAFNTMLDELESSRKELLLIQETLGYRVKHDSLTGLLNRNAIVEELTAESARCTRDGTTMAVMMADLDHFKRINDEFGHGMGDEALRRTSDLIRTSIRPYDRVGRFGGEEFLILAHNISQHDAMNLAERIRKAVSAVVLGGALPCAATLSIGVTLTAGTTDWHDVVAAADSALYEAKRGGRNRVEFATCESHSQNARTTAVAEGRALLT